ncbi:MAG: ABC transporter permease, partial [Actinomycetota bacterium]|nr:ABC transporter permease [Actinomycetota bacterium]
PVIVGLRFALEPGRGRTALPVRSALAGAVLAVTGVVAMGTFASSLHRLVGTPTRYGWPGDFMVLDVPEPIVRALVDDERVRAVARLSSVAVRLSGRQVPGGAFDVRKGSPSWTILEGRMPATSEEVALGTRLARQLDRRPGDDVEVDLRSGGTRRFRVVGVGIWSPLSPVDFGVAAVFAPQGLAAVGLTEPYIEALAAAGNEADAEALASELAEHMEVARRQLPADVDNLRQLERLPGMLGGFLAVVGIVTMGHALSLATRRRASDLAVLRSLGLTPRQAASTLAVMAVTTALVGVLAGVPLGLALGNLFWKAVARAIAVADDAMVSVPVLALVAPVAILTALTLAAGHIRRARRLQPAAMLRAE